MFPIRRALLSVTDKTGLVEFGKGLQKLHIKILSTGGTARALLDECVDVTEVSSYTGFPEMLDGRVKTLHPKIHGGILGIRDNSMHVSTMEKHGIEPIDMVVVNLYAFEKTVARPGCTFEEAIESIDIGGPTLIRAAGKNSRFVAVVTDPNDYPMILKELQELNGQISETTRLRLMQKAFLLTSNYDTAIAKYLADHQPFAC